MKKLVAVKKFDENFEIRSYFLKIIQVIHVCVKNSKLPRKIFFLNFFVDKPLNLLGGKSKKSLMYVAYAFDCKSVCLSCRHCRLHFILKYVKMLLLLDRNIRTLPEAKREADEEIIKNKLFLAFFLPHGCFAKL
jgi:hypothetical protein